MQHGCVLCMRDPTTRTVQSIVTQATNAPDHDLYWVVSTHLYGLLCVGVEGGSGTGQSACTDPTGVKRGEEPSEDNNRTDSMAWSKS